MGKVYRTAMGKSIDIDNLRLSNEEAIAVGNMKVNARGDQLGSGGKVIQGRNQTMDKFYKMHTPMAQQPEQIMEAQRRQGATVRQGVATPPPPVPEVDPDGVPFDTAPAETPAPPPAMRGSLADSIAREKTVKQELLTPPNQKPKGPSRI